MLYVGEGYKAIHSLTLQRTENEPYSGLFLFPSFIAPLASTTDTAVLLKQGFTAENGVKEEEL